MTLISGSPRADLPYRWGCPCGAIWNSDEPEKPTGPLCGPTCAPALVSLGCPCVVSDREELTNVLRDLIPYARAGRAREALLADAERLTAARTRGADD